MIYYTYKIMFGFVDLKCLMFFELSKTDNRLARGHRYKLTVPTTNKKPSCCWDEPPFS